MTRNDRSQIQTRNFAGIVQPQTSLAPEAIAERKRMALHGLAQGKSKSKIAEDLGVHRNTISNYLRDDPGFKEQWERVVAERDEELAHEFEDTAISLARGETTKDGAPLWPAVRHMLGVTNPRRHGDKKQVEHTGTVVHSLIPRARRLDELTDIIDVEAIERGEEEGE
jgi:transcriptional regulator with XRE-family HTH domain